MGKDSGIGVLDKSVMILHMVADQPCNLGELCELTGLPVPPPTGWQSASKSTSWSRVTNPVGGFPAQL